MAKPTIKYIKVAKLGERVKEFAIGNGTTVREALALADHSEYSPDDVFLNGRKAKLDKVVKNGDRITIVPKVAGS